MSIPFKTDELQITEGIISIKESAADPAAEADTVKIYAKESGGGVADLFVISDDGTISQISPSGVSITGDVTGSGTAFSATVVGLQGNPINYLTPGIGRPLVWTGTEWIAKNERSQVPESVYIQAYTVSASNIYTVGISEPSDFTDIQTAIATVPSGSTLVLRAEVFEITSTITINNPIKIIGTTTISNVTVIRTQASGLAPVTIMQINSGDVHIEDIGFFQRKTTNTGVECAIELNAIGGTNIVLSKVGITTMERGLVVTNADGWQFINGSVSYSLSAPATNSNKLIVITNSSGDSIIYNTGFVASDPPGAFKYTTFISLENGTHTGSLTIQDSYLNGPGTPDYWFVMSGGFGGAPGSFSLNFIGNGRLFGESYGDASGIFRIYSQLVSNPLNLFSSIKLIDNKFRNDNGFGLLSLDGLGSLTSGYCPIYADGNILTNPSVSAAGWLPAQHPDVGLIGFNGAIYS